MSWQQLMCLNILTSCVWRNDRLHSAFWFGGVTRWLWRDDCTNVTKWPCDEVTGIHSDHYRQLTEQTHTQTLPPLSPLTRSLQNSFARAVESLSSSFSQSQFELLSKLAMDDGLAADSGAVQASRNLAKDIQLLVHKIVPPISNCLFWHCFCLSVCLVSNGQNYTQNTPSI